LDDRKEDIPLLAEHFLDSICAEMGIGRKKIKPEAIQLLQNKSWTGNIRQFRNVIERLIILGGKEISPEDVSQFG
jgi:DNA-binding NtrC family response regulator